MSVEETKRIAEDLNKIGPKDWKKWLEELDEEERIVILIQSWSMMEVARLKLYDRILGKKNTAQFDEQMLRSFQETCENCGINPEIIIDTLSETVLDLSNYVFVEP